MCCSSCVLSVIMIVDIDIMVVLIVGGIIKLMFVSIFVVSGNLSML